MPSFDRGGLQAVVHRGQAVTGSMARTTALGYDAALGRETIIWSSLTTY